MVVKQKPHWSKLDSCNTGKWGACPKLLGETFMMMLFGHSSECGCSLAPRQDFSFAVTAPCHLVDC